MRHPSRLVGLHCRVMPALWALGSCHIPAPDCQRCSTFETHLVRTDSPGSANEYNSYFLVDDMVPKLYIPHI